MSKKPREDESVTFRARACTRFHFGEFSPEWNEYVHRRAVMTDTERILLRVRQWIESEKANGRSADLQEGEQANGCTLTLEAVHVA